jgi:hypothetical protein
METANDTPVSFPEWSTILATEPLDAATRERFRRAILAYLRVDAS